MDTPGAVAPVTGFHRSAPDVSGRKTYDLMDEPSGHSYSALLECALRQCDTAVVSVDDTVGLNDSGQRMLSELHSALISETQIGSTRLLRLRFDRDLTSLFELPGRLFAWRQPDNPENLSLLRQDGSPWLISIASERLGYVELAPFERLLLGRSAPALAAVLADHVTRDAILAAFERHLETTTERLQVDLGDYAGTVIDEGHNGLIDAVSQWLLSGDQVRVGAAVWVAGRYALGDLRGELEDLKASIRDESSPLFAVYGSNVVLRDRWKARFEVQLDLALASMPTKKQMADAERSRTEEHDK